MAEAALYAGDDVMLICRGSRFIWVSESAFFERGELVEVDVATELDPISGSTSGSHLDSFAQLPVHDVPQCAYQYLFFVDAAPVELLVLAIETEIYRQFLHRLAQQPFTAFPFQSALSRAPPFVLTRFS